MNKFHSKNIKKYYDKTYFLGGISKYTNEQIGVEGYEDFNNGKIYQKKIDCANMVDFKNKNVFDIGFGRGETLKYCYENGAKLCVGTDYSTTAFDIARKYLPTDIKLHTKAIDEIKDLEYNNIFEVVYIHDVLEHCPTEEWEKCFTHLLPKLKENFIICASTPSTESGPYLNLHNNYFNEEKINDLFFIFFKNIYFCNFNKWYYIFAEGKK